MFMLLLAVSTLAYTNMAEPIIRVIRYCLERYPPGLVFLFIACVADIFEGDAYVCSIIQLVVTCPRKSPYEFLLSLTFELKKTKKTKESVATVLNPSTRAKRTVYARSCRLDCRVRPSNSLSKHCLTFIAKANMTRQKRVLPR